MSGKPPGRPKKRTGGPRPNAGRKRIKLNEGSIVSKSTIDRRARELIAQDGINIAVLQKALQLLEERENNEAEH